MSRAPAPPRLLRAFLRRAVPLDVRDVELVQVAVDAVAHLEGDGAAQEGAREARGRGSAAHRALSDAGSSPCHMRSATCRASRRARAPSASSFT